MSHKEVQQAPTGQWEIVREPGSNLVDVWYVCGNKRERIAADVTSAEFVDIAMDDAKRRGMM